MRAGPMTGFPPPPDLQVDVSNWQEPHNLRWSLGHVREILSTQLISAGKLTPRPLSATGRVLGNPTMTRLDGSRSTVEDVFAGTFTDAMMVIHDGAVVDERYAGGITETTRHLIMSVSKSIVGCVSGVLVGQGKLDPASVVTDYVPELSESVTGVRPCVMSSTCKPGSGSARSTPTLTPRCGQWSDRWAGRRRCLLIPLGRMPT